MRAIFSFILMILIVVVMMPPVAALHLLRVERARKKLVHLIYRLLLRVVRIQLSIEGALHTHRPLLVVANHCSYADIFVLGAAAPLSFTPKSSIRWWPLVGWCCALSGCVFIDRKASKLPETQKVIHEKLALGRAICLFAEGTTNDGTHMHAFKSGFFSLAEGEEGLKVQPVTVAYTHINGEPLDEMSRKKIAWFGEETTLLPHLMRFLSFKRVDAKVIFHEPVTMDAFESRKALCAHVEGVVKTSLAEIQRG